MPSDILFDREANTYGGFAISQNDPEYGASGNWVWSVRNPSEVTYTGQHFYSSRFSRVFQLLNHIGDGHWTIEFVGEDGQENDSVLLEAAQRVTEQIATFENNSTVGGSWNISFATEDSEPEAEYTNYTINEPFQYNGHWNVVMENVQGREYRTGQIWFSEYENLEFTLGAHLRIDLFGSDNAYRITWNEEEHYEEYEPDYYPEDMDDGYSTEREEPTSGDVAPVIATNIGRNVPFVSFEQEFSGNGEMVAQKLYREGYAFSRYVESYHNSDGRYNSDNDRFCYVETDSSCGYELIFDRMQLNQRNQAEKISAVQAILRNLKNEGHINLSARCGFHVHVDVSDWGMKEIVSAYHLWNYLEDPIFRFASAFWGTHREEEVNGGYSTTVPKGHTSRTAIGRTLASRRDALNFSPILNAMGNCSCGASMYEDWANCTCNLRQPTLEFRVFNATTNQRKIRAYLAFCVAFVNIAKTAEFEPADFPEMRWRGTFTKQGIDEKSWEDCSIERINFILNEFPLTNAEKTDIKYCLRNSSLESVMEVM